MIYRLNDVELFASFCADTSADNCYDYADGAVPVYLDSDGDGEPVLTTMCGKLEPAYGYLYTLYTTEAGERTIVVRA